MSDKRNNGPKMAFLKRENSACNTSLGQKKVFPDNYALYATGLKITH